MSPRKKKAEPVPEAPQDGTIPDVVLNMNGLVGAAFRAANDKRARTQQKALGMSSLGTCRRQAAFHVLDHPHTNPPNERTDKFADSRESMIGTLIHELVLPQIREMSPTAEIEVPVVLKFDDLPEIPGSVDMADGDLISDVKTTGSNSAMTLRANGPKKRHLWQTHGYAQAMIDRGHDIRHIALVYIDRSNGQVIHVHYQQFDPTIVFDIREWWRQVNSVADPMEMPRDARGPGLDRECDWCPFLKACWGEDAVPGGVGIQSKVIEEVPEPGRAAEVEKMMVVYRDAAQAEKRAKADKEFAREVLSDTAPGTYGEWVLYWGRDSAFDVLDDKEAEKMLTAAGLPIPRKERTRKGAIQVRPKPIGDA